MSKVPVPPNNKWTVMDAVNWTTGYFQTHGIDSPRTTAELFLAHVLNLRRIDLYLRHDQPLHTGELDRFKQMIKRRVQREPAAYIIGKREFWSMDLAVTKDTLIPRPETECLVETALACLPQMTPPEQNQCPWQVVDLGTGSGAIILAMASERPGHLYYAMDRSPGALAVARQNAVTHDLADRVFFFAGNWATVFKPGTRFDLILSNPPYIPTKTLQTLAPEIQLYEPRGALDGGKDGLDDLKNIVVSAPSYLKPGGYLILEMGHDQKQGLADMVREVGFYEEPVFIRDYGGHDRVARLRKRNQK